MPRPWNRDRDAHGRAVLVEEVDGGVVLAPLESFPDVEAVGIPALSTSSVIANIDGGGGEVKS